MTEKLNGKRIKTALIATTHANFGAGPLQPGGSIIGGFGCAVDFSARQKYQEVLKRADTSLLKKVKQKLRRELYPTNPDNLFSDEQLEQIQKRNSFNL